MVTPEAKRRGWTEAHMKKEWVGLTGDEVQSMTHRKISPWIWLLLKEVETKLKEKNT
jgi:hypothetical protein